MPTLLTRILTTLAVMLVAGAQVFGLQRGYICHHHDVAVLTSAEHCHHAAESGGYTPCTTTHVEDHADDHADAHADEEPYHDEHSERHVPLKVSTTAATSSQAQAATPTFVAILITELPAFDHLFLLHAPAPAHSLKTPPHAQSERPPPAALQVAHSMVLRI
ncbi:hypothetical protein [Prosthecobacter sp.]|uniref:hypothetical protein n=1 Tax=Prosthecobacter sp. TaxID=1965333 RepID=UPI003784D615